MLRSQFSTELLKKPINTKEKRKEKRQISGDEKAKTNKQTNR